MNEHLPAAETYMRLALKAQSQCRATLETLANIKNPPTVFARQANKRAWAAAGEQRRRFARGENRIPTNRTFRRWP